MFQLLSDIVWPVVKPVMTAVLRKKNYPESAIDRKYGIIPEVGFNNADEVIMFHGVSVGEINAIETLVIRPENNIRLQK